WVSTMPWWPGSRSLRTTPPAPTSPSRPVTTLRRRERMMAATMTPKNATRTAVTPPMAYSDTCRNGSWGALMSSSDPMTKLVAPRLAARGVHRRVATRQVDRGAVHLAQEIGQVARDVVDDVRVQRFTGL